MTDLSAPRRIHVIGMSGSGKSTLGARLASALGLPFVELDALNWEPGWVGLNETDPVEFETRIREATRGDAWVVAGSYTHFCQRVFWDRLEIVVWLDLSMSLALRRTLTRSWRRWRTKELLWGTNYEKFWPQLKLWEKESLVHWILTQHRRKRRQAQKWMSDPAFSHIRFIRLTSPVEVERFVLSLERFGEVGPSR